MAVGWHVIGQREEEPLNAMSGFTKGIRVSFQLDPEGIVGSLFFPLNTYQEDNVREQIEAYVKKQRAVQNL